MVGPTSPAIPNLYPKITDKTVSNPVYRCDEYEIVLYAQKVLYRAFPLMDMHFSKFIFHVFGMIHDAVIAKLPYFVVVVSR